MQTALYTLFQNHEMPQAICFIDQVATILNTRRRLYILINDDDNHHLRAYAAGASAHIFVHCEGRNLGVAQGRNLIIKRAITDGAQFLVSCDTDIIYDAEYFDKLESAYLQLAASDPHLGAIQPLLIDGRQVRDVLPFLKGASNWNDVRANINADQTGRVKLWNNIEENLGLESAVQTIYHTGVSNIWRSHFGAPLDSSFEQPWTAASLVDQFSTDKLTLRHDPDLLKAVLVAGQPVRIASTAGGVSAFGANFFEAMGGYNNIFNPFGFEDSEFGMRAVLAGHKCYLVPVAVGIHDIFMGKSNRTLLSSARIGLLRGVETGQQLLPNLARNFALQQSLIYGWRDLLKPIGDAAKSGSIHSGAEIPQLLADFVLSYLFDFARGLFSSLSRFDTFSVDDFLRLLQGWIDEGECTIDNFEWQIGKDVVIFAGRALSRRFDANKGRVFSLYATNVRIEDRNTEPPLLSRYFDLSIVLEPEDGGRWALKIDILSNDHLLCAKVVMRCREQGSFDHGSIEVVSVETQHRQHEYGRFSLEDIYPESTFHLSTDWLPLVFKYLDSLEAAVSHSALAKITNAIRRYLKLGAPNDSNDIDTSPTLTRVASNNENTQDQEIDTADTEKRYRVLIFTDSRGQHKPGGSDHDIFAERLAKHPRMDVDMFLCPMKWTTTLDFLEQFPKSQLDRYDYVILYTGIVEWSPRSGVSACADLYDNQNPVNQSNFCLNTRDYSKKIVNNKKGIFDQVFGHKEMASHLSKNFDTVYEGQTTNNMYSIEMARDKLIPRLTSIPNLIFINANRFVPGWEGDFKRGRPLNISIAESYSEMFAHELERAGVCLVNLLDWSHDEIKVFTCDNIHLTKSGSDYIYEKLINMMGVSPKTEQGSMNFKFPNYTFRGFNPIERIDASKRKAVMKLADCKTRHLATLIIGVRVDPFNQERLTNLKFLLKWIDYYYGELFDVLVVEQDSEHRLSLGQLDAKPYVRKVFIYNPEEYNRGWGYNVAVKHYCEGAKVVALMDTDVLTGPNFLRDVIDCRDKIDVASPYINVYFTDKNEAREIRESMSLTHLENPARIKYPVTVAGGIVIWNRAAYMSVKGFEQYRGYSCEDRAMDVTIFNQIDASRIRISQYSYVHLYHEKDKNNRNNFEEIYSHLTNNYGCFSDPSLSPSDFIHKNCSHVSIEKTLTLIQERAPSFGDQDLYKRGDALSINGQRLNIHDSLPVDSVIFPTHVDGFFDYPQREVYANTPDPDTDELVKFYNRFKGKRCFIIGNGPSLNHHDLSKLENEYSFGVNSFYYKTRETGFRPTFYVVEDSSVMKENIDEIRAYEAPFKFFPTVYCSLHPKKSNTFFFNMNRGFYERSSPNYAVPRFSTDASRVLYCGQSVTYINLQLAYFMGFTEVYLIGMDFDYVIPDSHTRNGDVLLSDTDDMNHFHKDYFGKGKTWKDPKLDRVLMNYRMANLVYSSVGRKIFNATKGGKLEEFQRVDYDSLFVKQPVEPLDSCAQGSLNELFRFQENMSKPSLATANKLYREGKFDMALDAYLLLYQRTQLNIYKQNAIAAGKKIGLIESNSIEGLLRVRGVSMDVS